jgi:ankyrin repeat protein
MPTAMTTFTTLVAFLALTACSHKPTAPSTDAVNRCFQWVSLGDLQTLQSNVLRCKGVRSPHGTTLLMSASSRGRIEIMNELVSQQWNEGLDAVDSHGDTALFYASSASQTEAIAWLLAQGASPKSFRKDGITPFMLTLQNENRKAYNLFLSNTTQIQEINAATEDGWTALFFAVRKEDAVLLKKLLELGANPQILSNALETPLTLADEQQWKEGIALLTKSAKKPGPRR